MVAWPHSMIPPLLVIDLPRRFIVEGFPLEVREKIDFFISEGFNPRSVFEWLQENIYPKWREEGKNELCVTRRTIYNYMKNRCPENLLVSDSYLKEARKRVDEDIDAMEKIRGNIASLEDLLNQFDLTGKMTVPQISQVRLLLQALLMANQKYLELQMNHQRREERRDD